MKKDKKIFSYKAIVICSLIISVFSTSNAYAEKKGGGPTKAEKEDACLTTMLECEIQCDDKPERSFSRSFCLALHNCDVSYNACMVSVKGSGGFNKQTLGGQDVYVEPIVKDDKNRNKNTFVPNTGLIAPPPPKNSGSTRTQAKPAAPMNKSLVAPLVVPTKKTSTMPTVTQPKMRTMNAPTIQPKQPATKYRVEKPVKHKVAKPASTHKNKKSTKQASPTTTKGVMPKSNQPVMRKMNSAPAVNGSKSKSVPTGNNNFDEADAIFGRRTGISNTQAR